MSIVTRKRTDAYAIVPNAVANDSRLSFEERGLLVYLLAKPHDWKISIANIRNEGGVGRDKVYKMLKHLAEIGYVRAEQTKRPDGTFGQTDYTVYDDAVPDRLPFDPPRPEKPEAVAPLPENQDTGKPLPENPYPDDPYPENQDAYKRQKETNPPLPPETPGRSFEEILALWPADCLGRAGSAMKAWERLTAGQQGNAISATPLLVTAYRRRGKPVPKLNDFIAGNLWAEFMEAPELDEKGRFRITKDRPEWSEWLGDLRRLYGDGAVERAVMSGFLLRETRWPPAAKTAAEKRAATMEA